MSNRPAKPKPAIEPPEGREPERKILHLGDGYETSVFVHRPPADAPSGRRPVIYAHGIQSHPGWFYASALALAEAGHDVYQVTRRGSGDNTAQPGHARSAGQLLDDVDVAVRLVQSEVACDKVHLLGVSWGGKLLTAYSLSRVSQEHIASLTLIAPGLFSQVDVSPRLKLAIAACLLARPAKQFPIPLSDVELFTDNPDMQEYLRNDPAQLHHATARFMYVSRCLDKLCRRKGKALSLKIPTSLVISTQDRIIDNQATVEWLEKIVEHPLCVEEFPGQHTLEFDIDTKAFLRELVRLVERGEEE